MATAVDISYRRSDHLLVFGLTRLTFLPRITQFTVPGQYSAVRAVTLQLGVHSPYTAFLHTTNSLLSVRAISVNITRHQLP